jgi:transcriptional regulator with XRE-family HTH domain
MQNRERTIEQMVGERIRTRRIELGLVQEQLAAALGLSYQQIQKYENGSNRITVDRLVMLAHRLEVPITFFFAGLTGSKPSHEESAGTPCAGHARARHELTRAFGQLHDESVRHAVSGLVRTVVERQA